MAGLSLLLEVLCKADGTIVTGVTTTRTRMGAHITITGMGVRDMIQANRTGQYDDMQGLSGDTLVNE